MKRIILLITVMIVSGCGPEIIGKEVVERGEEYETTQKFASKCTSRAAKSINLKWRVLHPLHSEAYVTSIRVPVQFIPAGYRFSLQN